jgi:hypothetical protein
MGRCSLQSFKNWRETAATAIEAACIVIVLIAAYWASMRIALGIDELGMHAQPVAARLHVDWLALVSESGRAGDDENYNAAPPAPAISTCGCDCRDARAQPIATHSRRHMSLSVGPPCGNSLRRVHATLFGSALVPCAIL